MNEFQSQVLADLCVLKVQVESVIGGMQPGRLAQLERRVERHEVYLQRTRGLFGAFGVLLTLINIAVDYLRH
jgi:hypothetical protein